MGHVDINTLIKSAQSGNKNALEDIIKMYKPYIIKGARQIYINGYEVEDLIQIGVMALVKALNKYEPDRKIAFTTYAITAIKNAFNLELRKVISKKWDEKFKCSLNSVNKDGIEFMEMLASDEDMEEALVLKEKIDILRKSLDKLNEEDREIITWYYFENKTLKKYALKEDITVNTAAKRKCRAVERLKSCFFKEYSRIRRN